MVKGEVKGGEASKGPTRTDHLWQMPDVALISDEKLEFEPPKGLPPLVDKVHIPPANPITKGKVELGRQLYFDQRISKDSTVSCATCHDPAKAWVDNQKTSIGIKGQVGDRNAPTVLNTAYNSVQFWDGRAPSLEGQSQGPPQNKIEMGDQSYEEIVDRLRAIPGYRDQFKKVFGTDVNMDGIAKAIATFERVAALAGNSKYDKYQDADDADHNNKLSDSEKRGMVLFGLTLNPDDEFKHGVTPKKANCTACHVGFNFTDNQFHNLGVGWKADGKGFADPGRYAISPVGAKNPTEMGSFKTPTCRDAARTAPYMHDGSEKTLEDLVEYYNKGGNPNPTLDASMKPLNLTASEKADVVAFLKALTSDTPAVALPTLPTGPDGKTPDPKAALAPPSPKKADLRDMHRVLVR